MIRTNKLLWGLALTFMLTTTPIAHAFSDIQGDPGEASIVDLQQRGIIGGVDADTFAPKEKLSYAQGVYILVKAFDLNIDNIRFIKAPQASDSYPNADDDAWYASAFIIASYNGLSIPRDVIPAQPMTRSEFALLLKQAMNHGQDQGVTAAPGIGLLSLSKTSDAAIEEEQVARPNDPITRSEAAVMLHAALVKQNKPPVQEQIQVLTEQAAAGIQRVTLNWGEKPNPGYRIAILSIEFKEEKKAVIHYKLSYPEPGHMYPAVITEAKAETYLADGYTISIQEDK